MKNAKGFTLIEITVVLVIIGLLVAAVLGGRSLIESAKVSNVVATAKDLSIASKAFREKFKYWPGDLPNAASAIPNLPATCDIPTSTGQIGNGAIDTAAEISCAIEELFQAGFIRAELNPNTGLHSLNVDSIQARLIAASASNVTNFPVGTNVIEFANLPCSFALGADLKLDDGDIASTSSGKAKASVTSCIPGTTNDPVPFFAVAAN